MRRVSRKAPKGQTGVRVAQIVMLVAMLVAVLVLRGRVGDLTSRLMSVFSGPEDIDVGKASGEPDTLAKDATSDD